MNNTIYNSLYRTIEDRWEGNSDQLLLFNAIGVDNKYSLTCYVQATAVIKNEDRDISFKLHLKNDESVPDNVSSDFIQEDKFIEITDVSPVGYKPTANDPDKERSKTGILYETPIGVYSKTQDDGTSYFISIQDATFKKVITRQEIFFGATTGVLGASTEVLDDLNKLASIEGDVTNIVRSLYVDTLINEAVIIENLSTTKLTADNAYITDANVENTLNVETANVSGTFTSSKTTNLNGETTLNNTAVADNVTITNNGGLSVEQLDSGTINITSSASDEANIAVKNLTTETLSITHSENSKWNDINLLNPNKLYVGTDKGKWDGLSDGDILGKTLKFTDKNEANDSVNGIVTRGELTTGTQAPTYIDPNNYTNMDDKITTFAATKEMCTLYGPTLVSSATSLNNLIKFNGRVAYYEISSD